MLDIFKLLMNVTATAQQKTVSEASCSQYKKLLPILNSGTLYR